MNDIYLEIWIGRAAIVTMALYTFVKIWRALPALVGKAKNRGEAEIKDQAK